MKAARLAPLVIAAMVLTACASASTGGTTDSTPMGDEASAVSGMVKGSLPSDSPEESPASTTEESPASLPESASPSPSDQATSSSPSASLSTAPCSLKPGAVCDGADLSGMDLSGADLTGISLKGAKLIGANFSSANLSNAVLTDATISGAVWNGADLTGATTGFDALDPALQPAKTCRTRMAKGVVDSRGCPCRNVGAATAGGADAWMGSIGLGSIPSMPRKFARADGQLLPINGNQAMYALLGNTWGGDQRSNFALPQVTGPWAGMRTGEKGDGTCLQWAVATKGTFANVPVEEAFPGQVYFSAVRNGPFRDSMTEAGAQIDTTISAYLGKGFTAYALPATWPSPTPGSAPAYLGEIRLFTTSQPLPASFLPADGSAISQGAYPGLHSLLGGTLPLVAAPDGYRWAVAADGMYPNEYS